MANRLTVGERLDRRRNLEPVEDETQYYGLWKDAAAAESDPLVMAVQGGLCADRLAWVFIAGYQAAVRHTFGLELDGWVAFAVSEDRRDDDALPGVVTAQLDSRRVLRGYKTWIAAVDHIDHLIVKANRGEDARYFLLGRDEPGLSLRTKPTGSFLGELSQGVAAMDNVEVTGAHGLDASTVGEFAVLEPLYIYAAFCAFVSARSTDPDLTQRARDLVEKMATIVNPTRGSSYLARLDLDVQRLLEDCGSADPAEAGSWAEDRRLIAMYSPGFQRRAGSPAD